MTRYNLFHCVHKGLRALLYETGLLLQRTDFTLEEEAKKALGRLQYVMSIIEKCQAAEDRHITPVVIAYEPGVACSFAEEHEDANRLSQKLAGLIHDFEKLSLATEKAAAATALTVAFDEFMLFIIRHLKREEQFINKMMWQYFTDAELQTIAWKITSETDLTPAGGYHRWILRGLNNSEVVCWLNEVRAMAGENDFSRLLKKAGAELKPRHAGLWQEVLNSSSLAMT